jgi:hypothetical protein
MRRHGERPELIRKRLCGTSKTETWSFVPQTKHENFRASSQVLDNARPEA